MTENHIKSQAEEGPLCFEYEQDGNALEIIIEEDEWLTHLDERALATIAQAGLKALAEGAKSPQPSKLPQNKSTAPLAQKSPHHLAVIMLANDAHVRSLNKTYRGKDKATNILSFPSTTWEAAAEDIYHIGDAILSLETTLDETSTGNKPFIHHISHLMIHGVLHLLGYDHATDCAANEMETLEIKLMNTLGYKNPYSVERKDQVPQ